MKDTRDPMNDLTPESPFYPISREQILLETPRCVALFDKYPVSQGHALVVAKTVTASLFDLPPEVQAEVWDTVRRVREILLQRFQPEGFNIGINDGPAAGQTVPHAHVHLIPRYRHDVADPRGGIRWIIPPKARYWQQNVEKSVTLGRQQRQ